MFDVAEKSHVSWIAKQAKKTYRLGYSILKVGVGGRHEKNAAIVIWIPSLSLKYFTSDAFIKDMALITSLKRRNLAFTLCIGRDIGKYNGKIIFYNVNNWYNAFSFNNYMSIWEYISKQLENQKNLVFYTSNEVKYWENKVYMHSKFKEYAIPHPKTYIIREIEDFHNREITFPLLLKEVHSCSAQGIFKINDLNELKALIGAPDMRNRNNGMFIIQELLNIRKDLRVVLVGDEIVLHYWRINKTDAWRPTSTEFGSGVDFDYFPEQWRDHILETFKKLNLTTGAFDIAWQNDDLSTPPLYLEVSPSYQPNPRPHQKTDFYGRWKKSFNVFNSYDKAFIDLTFDIENKYVEECLNEKGYLARAK